MTPDEAQREMWQSTAVKIGLSHPFLLYELLALSALHLAHCKPDQQNHYYALSTELQNQALGLFNAHGKQVDSSNCAAVLLFSALLAHHVFADRSRTEGLDHSQYLDHVLSCISLMRIVRPLVIAEWWPVLQKSEIQPLLANPNPQPPFNNVPVECHQLSNLIKASDLTPSSVKAYEQAIERLLWLFELVEVPHKTHSTSRWVMAWPVQIQDDYFSLLNQRRPEALIILAYYGVVLHSFRKSWAISDAGQSLIKAVNAQVGAYWTQWLVWPNKILEIG